MTPPDHTTEADQTTLTPDDGDGEPFVFHADERDDIRGEFPARIGEFHSTDAGLVSPMACYHRGGPDADSEEIAADWRLYLEACRGRSGAYYYIRLHEPGNVAEVTAVYTTRSRDARAFVEAWLADPEGTPARWDGIAQRAIATGDRVQLMPARRESVDFADPEDGYIVEDMSEQSSRPADPLGMEATVSRAEGDDPDRRRRMTVGLSLLVPYAYASVLDDALTRVDEDTSDADADGGAR